MVSVVFRSMESTVRAATSISMRRGRGVDGVQPFPGAAYLYVALGIAFATFVLNAARHWLQWGEIALIYLPLIIAYAIWFGFGPGMLAAVLGSCACDYYFIPPYYTFMNDTPSGWLSLCVFTFVAVATARLASRIREKANEAEARERETNMLYEASQAISNEVDADRLLPTLAREVVRMTAASECAVLQYSPDESSLDLAAYASLSDSARQYERAVEGVARTLLEQYQRIDKESSGTKDRLELARPTNPEQCAGIYEALTVKNAAMGVLYVGYRADRRPFTHQDERLIRTLANHAAVVIARQRQTERSEEQARQTAVVEERNRLARDVHDALSHTFTGIKFLLEAADRVGPTVEARDCIAEARKLAVEGAQEARRSVLALRPASLEQAGDLASAIRILAQRQAAGDALDVDVEISGEPFPLPDSVEENLLRICQEAVANVLRHADAAQVTIGLSFEPGAVTLSVKDDGIGFDPEDVAPGSGFGLTSMRQRSTRLGAEFDVTSKLGEGTAITVRAPVRGQS